MLKSCIGPCTLSRQWWPTYGDLLCCEGRRSNVPEYRRPRDKRGVTVELVGIFSCLDFFGFLKVSFSLSVLVDLLGFFCGTLSSKLFILEVRISILEMFTFSLFVLFDFFGFLTSSFKLLVLDGIFSFIESFGLLRFTFSLSVLVDFFGFFDGTSSFKS